MAGVEEELDGDRQEVVGAHGPSGRVVLSRRTPRKSHRDLQSRQLPVHLQLRVVSPSLLSTLFVVTMTYKMMITSQVRECVGGADAHGRNEARAADCQPNAGCRDSRASSSSLHSVTNGSYNM